MNRHSRRLARDPGPDRRRRRLLIAGSILGAFLLVALGVGVYGLSRGPTPTAATPSASPAAHPSASGPDLAVLPAPKTRDGRVFARAVAIRLFDWDTSSEDSPSAYLQVLVNAAAPTDQVAVAADLAGYFPDQQTWTQLQPMQTRQWLTVTTVAIPAGWATAQAQAKPGQLPPGAVAFTVDGIRHRTGTWHTAPATYEHPVAFTIFLACPIDQPCRLLRLSGLDTPLR